MSEARARIALAEAAHGLQMARQEMAEHMAHTSSFAEMGQMMLKQWDQGMATSLQS
jgi:serine/threonine-protein kinase HipA